MSEADPKFPIDPAVEPPRRRVPLPVKIVLGILGVIFLAWAILFITKGRFLKHTFERIASRTVGRDVRIGGDFQLYFRPINIKFYAERLTIANPAWRTGKFFVADRIDTKIAVFPLILGQRRVNWLDLAGGRLDLAWDAAHKRNTFTFGDPNKPAKPFTMPDIRQGIIAGSSVTYEDPLLELKTAIRVDTVRADNTKVANDIRFSGTGTMRGHPFTLVGSLLSPNETIGGGENKLRLAAQSGPTKLALSGTLPGATVLEGAKLKLGVRGPDLRLLFDFLGAAVPDTRAYRFTSNLTKRADAWKFTRLTGFFGKSDLSGILTVSLPKQRLRLDADLTTRSLDIVDAAPFIGYNPDAAAAGRVTRVVGATPRLLPDAPLRIESIRRFDAAVKYRVTFLRAKSVPISNIALALGLDHSVLTLSPLTFDMAGGHLSSDIAINARVAPVHTDYDIRLSPTPMGRLLARFGVEESGTTGTLSARIKMAGNGDSLHDSLSTANGRIAVVIPKGSFWTRNIQLAEIDIGTYVTKLIGGKLKKPVQINCGLVAFTVRNGIAAADPILIDTQKNVMLGRGGFSFRNESLDLAFRADGKKFSLFSGQSPVGVNGYFAKPGFQIISPELLSRAGVGLGLAIVASPLAGVLAFVDIGDAKSASCGPVLGGATAQAQRTIKGQHRDDVGHGTTAKAEDGKKTPSERKEQRKKFLGIF